MTPDTPLRFPTTDIRPSFVTTTLLRVAYEDRGPRHGRPLLLLHGWPDDVRTWDGVLDRLHGAGYRTIAPSPRGFGATQFLDAQTMRSGQVTALARDVVDFLDAIGLSRVTLVGHDWGGRTAYAVAALWPERIERMVVLSVGYDPKTHKGADISPKQAHQFWYQWLFQAERGREALQAQRRALCRYIWQVWAPSYQFSDEQFETTAASWDNPDWVDLTLHYYRYRWRAASSDPRYDDLESRMSRHLMIHVPTTVLHGADDGAALASSSALQEQWFDAGYVRRELPGVGHFPQRECPDVIADAILRNTSAVAST
jgi:pimeloyl-ACP methyl ester carboxylesterase